MTRADACKAFLADLARPFALYAVGGSTAVSIVRLAWVGSDLSGAAVFITAALGGLGVLYGARAWENARAGSHAAEVEKAKAKVAATPPPGTAQITAAPDVDVTVRDASDDGDPTRFGGPRE